MRCATPTSLIALLLLASACKPPVQLTPPPADAPAAVVALSGASVLIGASSPAQLDDNLASLQIRLSDGQRARLDEASAPDPVYPYPIFAPAVNRTVFGGASVRPWRS